jgi:hypothetical protein
MKWNFWKKTKNKIVKPYFPCSDDNCLVRAACTKPCEKIEMDDDKLVELFDKYNNVCPDCGNKGFFFGPCGGMSQNIKCTKCGHYFNAALPFFVQRIHVSGGVFHNSW